MQNFKALYTFFTPLDLKTSNSYWSYWLTIFYPEKQADLKPSSQWLAINELFPFCKQILENAGKKVILCT